MTEINQQIFEGIFRKTIYGRWRSRSHSNNSFSHFVSDHSSVHAFIKNYFRLRHEDRFYDIHFRLTVFNKMFRGIILLGDPIRGIWVGTPPTDADLVCFFLTVD